MNKKPKSTPWEFWQPLFLRSFVKRRMLPMTPMKSSRNRFVLSIAYFICTCMALHKFVFDNMEKSGRTNLTDADVREAVKWKIDEAKIVRIHQGNKIEIIDFDRDDYEHLADNVK